VITQVQTDVQNEINSVERSALFAAAAAAGGAMLYESNRIAGALAGFAVGLYLSTQ